MAVALLLAPLTRPSQADHERKVGALVSAIQAGHLADRAYLRWVLTKGIDLARKGRFEEGVLTSTYHVELAGHELGRCIGMLGMVWCRTSVGRNEYR